MNAKNANRLKSLQGKKNSVALKEVEDAMANAARNYSISMVSLLFLACFILLAGGLLSNLPTILYSPQAWR